MTLSLDIMIRPRMRKVSPVLAFSLSDHWKEVAVVNVVVVYQFSISNVMVIGDIEALL